MVAGDKSESVRDGLHILLDCEAVHVYLHPLHPKHKLWDCVYSTNNKQEPKQLTVKHTTLVKRTIVATKS